MKKYIAIARVSSREQQQEGYSLDVQEEAFNRYAADKNGVVAKLFRIVETASRRRERRQFREAIAYAKENARNYDGLLFHRVDRAARNMTDFVEIFNLMDEYDLLVHFLDSPSLETPSGRMAARTLASVSILQTEQQSVNIKDGLRKRVRSGLFPSHAPYGYRNVRGDDKRSRIEVNQPQAIAVRRAFKLRASQQLTVEQIIDRLHQEGVVYCDSRPKFTLSKMHHILQDRSYIGEVFYRKEWHKGEHQRLIDDWTWERVQALLHNKTPKKHSLLFANELVCCGHCQRPVTGERKVKSTKRGMIEHIYYRCCRYTSPSHPRIRVKEKDLDFQAKEMLQSVQFLNAEWEEWAKDAAADYLRSKAIHTSLDLRELKRQISLTQNKREQLLDLLLAGSVTGHEHDEKKTKLLKRESELVSRVAAIEQSSKEIDCKAKAAPSLFDKMRQKWDTWDVDTKHRVLRLLFGGFRLDGVMLVQVERTPIELFRQSSL